MRTKMRKILSSRMYSKLFSSRRAEGEAVKPVVTLILALAVGLVVIAMGSILFSYQKEESEIKTCALSFLALDTAKEANDVYDVFGKGFHVNCPRTKLNVASAYLIKNKVTGVNEVNDEKMNKLLAEEMYKCWKKVGEGKLRAVNFPGNEDICFVCTEITFSKEVAESKSSIDHLNEYLLYNRIPDDSQYYSDYFGYNFSKTQVPPFKYDVSQNPLYIIYKIQTYNPSTTLKWTAIALGAAEAATVGTKAGCATGTALSFLAPGVASIIGCVTGLVGGGLLGAGASYYVTTTDEKFNPVMEIRPASIIGARLENAHQETNEKTRPYCTKVLN